MESDLIDISREDDSWLLRKIPSEGASSLSGTGAGANSNGYFGCSPLQIPRSNHSLPSRPPFSPTEEVIGNKTTEQLSPSSVRHSVNKENISGNKMELPKLSVERQQMKRKKKSAGYNLRKSLAWNRAFFTEEGVLDSVELSIIAGNDCQTGGEMLGVIQEEQKESISALDSSSDSPGLRALEEDLFKELPVNSKNKEKKVVPGVLPKNASPSKVPASLAKKKVLSAQDARSASKRSGCPRHLASSSPANAHMTKARNKELRLSKVSASRSDSPMLANTAKMSTQGPSKAKQIQPAQSTCNSQRNFGFGSSSNKILSAQTKAKSNLASKSSIPKPSLKQARRNVISVASEIPSASNSQPSVVVKSDDGPVAKSDLVLDHASSDHIDSSNIAVPAPQSSSRSIGNMCSAIPRVPRPSGLRMPSPSIGFFTQSKLPSSHGSLEKDSQAPDIPGSGISYSSTHCSLIPTGKKSQVPEKVPDVVNANATTGNISILSSTTDFSAPSRLLPSSQRKIKVDLKITREVESKVPSNTIISQVTGSLQYPRRNQGDSDKRSLVGASPYKSEKLSAEKGTDILSNDEKSPFCSKSNEQENKTSDGKKDEESKSCTLQEDHSASGQLKHGPIFKDPMVSKVEDSCNEELKSFDDCSQAKVSNEAGGNTYNAGGKTCNAGGNTCNTDNFSGDLDGLGTQGQPLDAYLLPGNEDSVITCLLGEREMLVFDDSTENVAKQLEVVDSYTVDPAFQENSAPIKSNADDLFSSENKLCNAQSVVIPLGPVEGQDCIKSPCNHYEEDTASDTILGGHDIVLDGQATSNLKKTGEVSGSIGANCDANFVETFLDCRDLLRESEDQHFSCQLVHKMQESHHEIDAMTRNETADMENASQMHIGHFVGCLVVEQTMEQANLAESCSPEVSREDQNLKPSHEHFSERLTFEEFEQFGCRIIENASEEGLDLPIKQADQMEPSDGSSEMHIGCCTGSPVSEQTKEQVHLAESCSPEVSREGQNLKPSHEHFSERLISEECKQFSCCIIENASEGGVDVQIEQTDQIEPLDGCSSADKTSDKEPEENSEPENIDLANQTELVSHRGQLSLKGILCEGFREVDAIQTVSGMPEKFNALGTESNNPTTSTSGDSEPLNSDKDLPLTTDYLLKKDSGSGSVKLNKSVEEDVRQAEIRLITRKESCVRASCPELSSREKKEAQPLRKSLDPKAWTTSKEESGVLISKNEALSVGVGVQPHESIILNNNEANASERSSSPNADIQKESESCICASGDKDKMNSLKAETERKQNMLAVKPLPKAVPFSDEWLAAIEAAGEEILTLKTGPVQHSPPEKVAPEQSPWSPVKRKNHQGIGPFDCTKFTNNSLPPASD